MIVSVIYMICLASPEHLDTLLSFPSIKAVQRCHMGLYTEEAMFLHSLHTRGCAPSTSRTRGTVPPALPVHEDRSPTHFPYTGGRCPHTPRTRGRCLQSVTKLTEGIVPRMRGVREHRLPVYIERSVYNFYQCRVIWQRCTALIEGKDSKVSICSEEVRQVKNSRSNVL